MNNADDGKCAPTNIDVARDALNQRDAFIAQHMVLQIWSDKIVNMLCITVIVYSALGLLSKQ